MIGTRLYAEIGGAIALLVLSVSLWVSHNHKEQSIGAAVCISKTTITKQEATVDVDKINREHAAQLAAVVGTYESKLDRDRSDAAGLAQRLRDADRALRAGPLPAVPAATGQVCSAEVDAAVGRLEEAHAPSFEACLENQDEVAAIRAAWMKIAGQKEGAQSAPVSAGESVPDPH